MFYTYYKTYGGKILFRYKEDGNPHTKSKVVDFYEPTLYFKSEEETEVTSIYDEYLKPHKFSSLREAMDFSKRYENVDSLEIHGNSNYANQFIIELFDGQEPNFDPNLIREGILDIEVQSDGEFPEPEEAKWPINGVTIYDSVEDKFYSFMLKNAQKEGWCQSKSDKHIQALNVQIALFDQEEDVLRAFITHIKDQAYDLTSGWHSEGFDMPYLVNRCYSVLGEKYTAKMLSPFGKINIREIMGGFGKVQQKVDIVGLPHLDYMELYKKHIFTPRESYKLDFIAHEELGEKKINYEESSTLFELYEKNFQKFTDYNIQDVNLIRRLDAKLGLFALTYALAYYSMSNYEDTLGTVKVWESLVAKYLYANNQAPMFKKPRDIEHRDFEGAYVKEPKPGFYDWVISYDLASLYPHIEQQVNIGPETLVKEDDLPDELKEIKEKYNLDDLLNKRADLSVLDKYDLSMAANFEFYRKDKMSFFSAIKRNLYDQRKTYKKKMKEAQNNKVRVEEEMRSRGLI